jgi:hypothetical protein
MRQSDQDLGEIQVWADRFGSGRLLLALQGDEPPQRLYLQERARYELPGFELDVDGSMQATSWSEPSESAAIVLDSVVEYLEHSGIVHTDCELVRRRTDYDDRPAIRIRGWEGGLTAIAYLVAPDGHVLIDEGYPYGVPGRSDSPLRPTAFGSAYGLRHPAAQEALRTAAIIWIDQLGDLGSDELREYLPPDAHDLIDDGLLRDFTDTLYLVGWKFGQPRRLMLSSLAEQIAGSMLIREAETVLELENGVLTPAGMAQARQDLRDFEEMVLEEEFLAEYLPSVEVFELEQLLPSGIASRRAALWAPWYAEGGEPPPRAIGDDESRWSVTDKPGLTARQSVAADSEERKKEQEAGRRSLGEELAGLQWQLELQRQSPYLVAQRPDGEVVSFRPPPALFGANRFLAERWMYGRYPNREAAFDLDVEPKDRATLDWPDFFRVFPGSFHSLAVDAVFAVIEEVMGWVAVVSGHALPGGAVAPFEQSAKALEGIVGMRGQLERCRATGLVHDDRLKRYGIRHELFGADDLRFVAEARFAVPPGRDFDRVLADFNQAIYDFSPLPVSLGIEPYGEGDDSVIVRCAMGAESVEDAHDLADEVISQVLWRVGLPPIDLDEGDDSEEVGFEIIDRQHGGGPED